MIDGALQLLKGSIFSMATTTDERIQKEGLLCSHRVVYHVNRTNCIPFEILINRSTLWLRDVRIKSGGIMSALQKHNFLFFFFLFFFEASNLKAISSLLLTNYNSH